MKKLFSLEDLLREQLRDLFNAEENYRRHLTGFITTATSIKLRDQLKLIEGVTFNNARDIADMCHELGVPATGVTCEAMDGLIREAKDTTSDWGDTATIDAALIANAQRIVHYEIAGFGTAKEFARLLNHKEISRKLHEMLQQAFAIDQQLTRIATGGWFYSGINREAADIAA
jgi:ferritin-like metal-binding protein YciE